jgi:hypothetical protein
LSYCRKGLFRHCCFSLRVDGIAGGVLEANRPAIFPVLRAPPRGQRAASDLYIGQNSFGAFSHFLRCAFRSNLARRRAIPVPTMYPPHKKQARRPI